MHAFVTYDPTRRVTWKGHEKKEGVRRAIRYAREFMSVQLRVFAVVEDFSGEGVIHEVPSHEWQGVFFGADA